MFKVKELLMVMKMTTGSKADYYIEPNLKKRLLDDVIKKSLDKEDRDYVLVIDGAEGSGKSTFALQIGRYIDPSLDLSRVCFDGESFQKAIINSNKGQCVIFDEAFVGLSSRSAVSRMNNTIVSMMMQMRQKNLFVIIVLPSFFLLDKYVAMWRCKYLLHVYERKLRRGYFIGFTEKKKKGLYLLGKKGFSYKSSYSKAKGRFYGKFAIGEKEVEEEYRTKKAKAFERFSEEELIDRDYSKTEVKILRMALYKALCEIKDKFTLTNYAEWSKEKLNLNTSQSRLSQNKAELRKRGVLLEYEH